MLKFKRVSEEQVPEILKSITTYTEISQNGSSIKKVSFESSIFGKGYLSAESYSGLEVFIEQKPKFWVLAISDRNYCSDDDKAVAKKFVSMKHKFASRPDAEDFISDMGSAKNALEIVEIDPNDSERSKETLKEFNLDEIPF